MACSCGKKPCKCGKKKPPPFPKGGKKKPPGY